MTDQEKINDTVEKRKGKEKELILDQLRKTPVIQIACEKTGIARATYYRWRKEDETFAKLADEAVREGALLVNDLAESQLLAAIRDQNMTAIVYWLKHHHPTYATKVEVTAKLKREDDKLTPEQQALVDRALRFVAETHNTNDDLYADGRENEKRDTTAGK